MIRRLLATVTLVGLLQTQVLAAEVKVLLSGTALEGVGPQFTISIGPTVVGTGSVDLKALPAGQPFSFQVPDSDLRAGESLSIRLTNDKYVEGLGDINLYVLSASVDGREFAAADFSVVHNGAPEPPTGKLFANSWVASLAPPEGGWTVAAPAVECALAASVTGFAANMAMPSTKGNTEFEALLAQAKSGKCRVEIVGYASRGGPVEANRIVSEQRARAVAEMLSERGARFTSIEVKGFGSTDMFGSDQASNQRVTIQLIE